MRFVIWGIFCKIMEIINITLIHTHTLVSHILCFMNHIHSIEINEQTEKDTETQFKSHESCSSIKLK